MTIYKKDEVVASAEFWGTHYELRHQIYKEKNSECWVSEWVICQFCYEDPRCYREWAIYKNGTYAKKVFAREFC